VQVWREADEMLDDKERAALGWPAVAETHGADDAFEAARPVFSEKEVVDIMLAIGLMNAYSRLAIGFRRSLRVAPSTSA
jgi:alkylhydroperoxidase family enzyme